MALLIFKTREEYEVWAAEEERKTNERERHAELWKGIKKDYSNQRIGKLLVLEPSDKHCGGCIVWRCKCDCGRITYVAPGIIQRRKNEATKACQLCAETAISTTSKLTGSDLRRMRVVFGKITQRELARRMGVSPARISQVELSLVPVSSAYAARVRAALLS